MTELEPAAPERIWAGDFNGQGFGHSVAGVQGGLYEEYILASSARSAIAERDARIAKLLQDYDAAYSRGLKDGNRQSAEQQQAIHAAEARAEAAEALLKEAGGIIKRAQQNTPEHFSNWHGAARSLASKIGVKDE